MTTARRRPARQRRGFALFLSLLLLLVLTISGVALMFNTSVEDTLAGVETKVSKTFYAADSGIEYAQAALSGSISGTLAGTGRAYVGGTVPEGLSSNIPGQNVKDITIVVTPPVQLGWRRREGEDMNSNIGEELFTLTSTATSATLQSSKSVTAQFTVYPWVKSLP